MNHLILLNQADYHNVDFFGHKAANLARLIQTGFNVPNGAIIPTVVFDSLINSLMINIDVPRIKDILTSSPILDSILCEIPIALACNHFAIRSSSVFEDATDKSFAGVFESYLNVQYQNLKQFVISCWMSLYGERTLAYIANQNVNSESHKMAVLIQEFIEAFTSGVLFTTHPVTKDSSVVYIEVVSGLGESLVSGYAIPETYTVLKHRLVLLDVNTKTAANTLHPFVNSFDRKGSTPLLSKKALENLVTVAIQIECLMGAPQDIEFAFTQGNCHPLILQARPMTA